MNTFFATAEIVGIIRVLEDGKTYEVLYGFGNDSKPTSELDAHLMILERKSRMKQIELFIIVIQQILTHLYLSIHMINMLLVQEFGKWQQKPQ